ncbi:MAG: hypothetical protein QOI41_2699 [Myxococcales bacterium]|nr:hypothetical protein [Myxococcales bacterium]
MLALALALTGASVRVAAAQARDPAGEPPPLPPSTDPLAEPPSSAPAEPLPEVTPPLLEPPPPRIEPRAPSEEVPPEPEPMSEGRRIVVAYNTGFQWGLAPGVVFSGGNASFFLGLRFGYGVDTSKVIVVPGVRLSAYFTDPNVYLGMPVMKLVYPIDRFAPFVEGGAGIGYVAGFDIDARTKVDPKTGLALLVGGGFMLHFSWRFGLGVEANYQTVTGTDFHGFGIGPLLAIAF